MQRCTVHKHRNLLAHAPERLHEEIGADYTDMIYAATPEDIATRRKAFVRKWRLKHRPVADSLEEAGDRLKATAWPENLAITIPQERDANSAVKVSKANVATRWAPKS